MRLAHFSDIHVTIRPTSIGGKRLAGTLNYWFGGRRQHFTDVEHRIQRLLEDVDAQGVDHALCTGDVTQMSFVEEFARCAKLFGDRSGYTVIPGNHDRYTEQAASECWFERHFGDLAPPEYPYAKPLADGVTAVLLDVARPCSLFESSGLCGDQQREAARELIRSADGFVVVALHYGFLRGNGRPDRASHGIVDYEPLLQMLQNEKVDLVLHGHMHESYTVKADALTIVCAGSATDLYRRCGYNVYEIDPERKTFTTTRRTWNPAEDRYG